MFTLKQLADNFLNYNINKIFLNKSRQRFKKEKQYFLFSGISSDILLLISFYVSLYIFEDIFCWITRVTFRWIVLLFSFCFHCHKTNYVSNDWNNNVCLRLIPRLDLCAPGLILLNKERQRTSLFAKHNQISSKNLIKTLHIFHKMICKSKKFFARDKLFSFLCSEIFANRFCFTNSNPVLVHETGCIFEYVF